MLERGTACAISGTAQQPNTTVPGSLSELERGTVRAGEGHCPCHPHTVRQPNTAVPGSVSVLERALPVPPPAATGHGSPSPGATLTAVPSPSAPSASSATDVPVPSLPLCPTGSQPCRHEHWLPSPTHHLEPAGQLHITVSTPICKASSALCPQPLASHLAPAPSAFLLLPLPHADPKPSEMSGFEIHPCMTNPKLHSRRLTRPKG